MSQCLTPCGGPIGWGPKGMPGSASHRPFTAYAAFTAFTPNACFPAYGTSAANTCFPAERGRGLGHRRRFYRWTRRWFSGPHSKVCRAFSGSSSCRSSRRSGWNLRYSSSFGVDVNLGIAAVTWDSHIKRGLFGRLGGFAASD